MLCTFSKKMECWDDMFTQESFEFLAQDAKIFSTAITGKKLKHGKSPTNWLPKEKKPRMTMEAVARAVMNELVSKKIVQDEEVAGAEWWVTRTKPDNNVQLHYDKDEGVASEDWYMKFPLRSTIFYIDNNGAGTLVLNQRTDRHGNKDFPTTAKSAWLSMPKANRFCHFQSDLHHGVFGKSRHGKNNDFEYRYTLAINIWDSAPKEPYSVYPSNERLKAIQGWTKEKIKFGKKKKTKAYRWVKKSDPISKFGKWKRYGRLVGTPPSKRHVIYLPPNPPLKKLLRIYFPEGTISSEHPPFSENLKEEL